MTTQKFDVKASVTLNVDAEAHTHTMRDLTEAGLNISRAEDTIANASKSIAGHYLVIAQRIEASQRAKRGTKFQAVGTEGTKIHKSANEDDQETLVVATAILKRLVGEELTFLKSQKGWTKNKMPNACDQAYRKILNAWKHGFSLTTFDSMHQCEKANRDAAVEKEHEAYGGADTTETEQQAQGIEGTVSKGQDAEVAANLPAEVQLLVDALTKAYAANPTSAKNLVEASVRKAEGIVSNAASAMADKSKAA